MDRGLLSNATSADDSPTPGYMLNEISRATTANYNNSVQLQEYLLSRVTKNNHNVKFKCLVIIKHVCRTGRPEFKKEMGRNVNPIKECLQYRGPPDPLRGDEIYKRVRDAAREALDAIFDSQMPVTTSSVAAANRIQGMGGDYVPTDVQRPSASTGMLSNIVSSISTTVMGDGTDATYAGHPGAQGSFNQPSTGVSGSSSGSGAGGSSNATGGNSSGMVGLGNPNFSDARLEKSWYERAREMAVSTSQKLSNSSEPNRPNSGSSSGEYNYTTNRGNQALGSLPYKTPQQNQNSIGSSTNTTGWQQTAGGNIGRGSPINVPQRSTGVVPDMPTLGGPGSGRAGAAQSDGSYERNIIETLCEPGGLKPVPPEQKLKEFVSSAQGLNEEVVGNCLLDVLNSDAWQSRTKALIVIANLVKIPNYPAHLTWWQGQVEEIQSLLSDSKAGVRTQAAKVLRAMGVDTGAVAGTTSTARRVSSSGAGNGTIPITIEQSSVSLLDTEEYDVGPLGVAPSSATAPTLGDGQQPSGCISNEMEAVSAGMFAGMAISPSPSGAVSPVPSVLQVQQQQPLIPAATAAAPVDLFEGTSISPPQNVQPPAQVQEQKNTTGAVDPMSHFDLLDDTPPPPPVPPLSSELPPAPTGTVAAGGGDLFSGMNLQSSSAQHTNKSTVASTGNTGSSSYQNDLASLTFGAHTSMPMNNRLLGVGVSPQQLPVPLGASQHAPTVQGYDHHNLHPTGNYPHPSRTPPPGQQPYGQGHYMNQAQQTQQTQPPRVIPGSPASLNVIAPGMLGHAATRKAIPTAEDAGNSSFTFIAGSGDSTGGRRKSGEDSFSFVRQEMEKK